IEMGAPDPRKGTVKTNTINIEKGRLFWAYQPPKSQIPPSVKNDAWPRKAMDRFVLARLEASGLRPTGDADPETRLRRGTDDLTGMRPTPEEVDAFVNDRSEDAFEKRVDQLLASPRFGERWGRHWLDVARYGESLTLRGMVLPQAWRYRDFVIDALNNDM